jgi:energy-coupling factor transporter ATP-binding protein EcfA2
VARIKPKKNKASAMLEKILSEMRKTAHLPSPLPLYATLGSLIGNYLVDKDPVWMMLVGASGSGKSMMLGTLKGIDIIKEMGSPSSEAAFLTAQRQKRSGKDDHHHHATGGLLFEIGKFGILQTKDFTTVLSSQQDKRAQILAALREIYDGDWHRSVGSDGAQRLTWSGKCGFIGGVTFEIDKHFSVISKLGDRWLYWRYPYSEQDAYRTAMMVLCREERPGPASEILKSYMDDLGLRDEPNLKFQSSLTAHDMDRIIRMATFTASARVVIDRNVYQKDDFQPPQIEAPTRITNGLLCIYTGMEYIGVPPADRWKVLYRITIDSVPLVRGMAIKYLLSTGNTPCTAYALGKSIVCGNATAGYALSDLSTSGVVERVKGGRSLNGSGGKSGAKDGAKDDESVTQLWRLSAASTKLLERVQKYIVASDEEWDAVDIELD